MRLVNRTALTLLLLSGLLFLPEAMAGAWEQALPRDGGYELEIVRAVSQSRPQDAVALLDTYGEDARPRFKGTAFALSDSGTIVTSYHTIAGAHGARVTFPDGTTAEVQGVREVDRARDIAFLMVEEEELPVLTGTDQNVKLNDRVTVVGYPGGVLQTVSGRITARGDLSGTGGGELLIVLESPLGPGASGGPVLDSKGAVVAVVRTESSSSGYEVLALSLEQIRSFDNGQVIATLTELAAEDADNSYYLYHLGNLIEQQGELEKAIVYYTRSLDGNPYFPPAHLALGLTYRKMGRLEAAAREYQEALRIKPDYGPAHNNLGVIYGNRGMVVEEISHYLAALRINPLDVQAHNNLGTVFMRMGRIEDALKEYRVALSINPYLQAARRNLARAYQNKMSR